MVRVVAKVLPKLAMAYWADLGDMAEDGDRGDGSGTAMKMKIRLKVAILQTNFRLKKRGAAIGCGKYCKYWACP